MLLQWCQMCQEFCHNKKHRQPESSESLSEGPKSFVANWEASVSGRVENLRRTRCQFVTQKPPTEVNVVPALKVNIVVVLVVAAAVVVLVVAGIQMWFFGPFRCFLFRWPKCSHEKKGRNEEGNREGDMTGLFQASSTCFFGDLKMMPATNISYVGAELHASCFQTHRPPERHQRHCMTCLFYYSNNLWFSQKTQENINIFLSTNKKSHPNHCYHPNNAPSRSQPSAPLAMAAPSAASKACSLLGAPATPATGSTGGARPNGEVI